MNFYILKLSEISCEMMALDFDMSLNIGNMVLSLILDEFPTHVMRTAEFYASPLLASAAPRPSALQSRGCGAKCTSTLAVVSWLC